jgi:hypothetical protein
LQNPGSTKGMMAEWARRAAIVLACAVLFLIPTPASRGDSGAPQELPPDIVVATYPLLADSESFDTVIADAVRYRLMSRGLAVSFQSGAPSAADLEARARETGAAITLSCTYSVVGSQMSISLLWRDLQKKAPPVVREEKGPLDLMLDSVIFKALDDLLSSVQERVKQLASLREAVLQARAKAAHANEEAGRAPAAPAPAPAAPTRMNFSLSTSFASFIPIGPASYYFSVGLFPSLLASLRFITPAGRFAVGLFAGVNFFSATGPSDSAKSFLIPLGPDIRYEIGDGTPFLAFAHVSGGPVLLVLNTDSQGTLTDFTAFLKSGIGVSFMFTPRFGVSLIADYEVYFEMPYLIMGFSPTVMVTLEL